MGSNVRDSSPLLTKLRGKKLKQAEALAKLRNYLQEGDKVFYIQRGKRTAAGRITLDFYVFTHNTDGSRCNPNPCLLTRYICEALDYKWKDGLICDCYGGDVVYYLASELFGNERALRGEQL